MQMHLSAASEEPDKFTFEVVYKQFLGLNKINQKKMKKKRRSNFSSSESGSDSEPDSDSEVPKRKKKVLASSGYDTDESSQSSSSDEEPVKRKKKERSPKRTDQKDPQTLKVMEEIKELLTSKSSSEMSGVDLRGRRQPKSALGSFEVSPATIQEPENTRSQKVTIELRELRKLLASEVLEVNMVGMGYGRKYPQQMPYQQPRTYQQAQLYSQAHPQSFQQSPQFPSQAPEGYQSQYWVPTCFACGLKGHLRPQCTNPPLPAEEQQRLCESIMYNRDRASGEGPRKPYNGPYGAQGQRHPGQYPNQRFQGQAGPYSNQQYHNQPEQYSN